MIEDYILFYEVVGSEVYVQDCCSQNQIGSTLFLNRCEKRNELMLIYLFVSDILKFYAGYMQNVKEMSATTHQVNFRDGSYDLIGMISSDMVDDDIFKRVFAD